MKIDWGPMRRRLADFRTSGLVLPMWWRDDDAIAHTPALEHLCSLSSDLQIDVHIAVIPDLAESSLPDFVAGHSGLVPVVHGWRHQNHAAPDAKKSEFGIFRNPGSEEIHNGLKRLQSLFGSQVLPLFVPPWNRIDPYFFPVLSDAGFRGISTFSPRKDLLSAPGLVQINTHIDPIDWHGSRDLKDPEILIAQILALLEDRRAGTTDNSEPLGYLTHHLVHSEKLWEFSRQLLSELLDGGVTPRAIAPMLETSK